MTSALVTAARPRIGVVGATGVVGSAIVRQLAAEGWPVVAVVRNALGAALLDATIPGVEVRVGGTARGADGTHVLDDCEIVVNCALAGSGGLPKEAYRRNRAIVDGLLSAKSVRWLVHFSTVAIYGETIAAFTDEQRAFESPTPESEYGRSKLDVERHAVRQAEAKGVRCTVLRLGHVIGPGIYRSREIIELARNPRTTLPYAGRLPSNCIHVDTLARSIAALVARGDTTGVRSFTEHAWTWREVFQWHADAVGCALPGSMDDAASDAGRAAHRDKSVLGDVRRWFGSLPIKQLVRSPAVFDLALRTLVVAPDWLTQRVSRANKAIGARAAASVSQAPPSFELPGLYYSAGVPGPFLALAPLPESGPGSLADRTAALATWYTGLTVPRLPGMPRRAGLGAVTADTPQAAMR